jgi:hypothetical protein
MHPLTRISALAIGAGLLLASGGCALFERRTAAERNAEQRAYAETVVGELYECVTVEGRARAADDTVAKQFTPAIAKICSCYIDADFSEPSLHTLRLSIDASGSIRDIRDTASADASQFGACPRSSLRGLAMPRPPRATVLDVRLSDVVLAP